MSKIQVNEIVNHFDTGAPDCPKGLTVTGFTTFTGSASFSGDVSIGGTLTYEDVTNIDSVGIITAQSGVHYGTVGSGVTIDAVGTGTSLGFLVDGSERVRIDSSGRLLVGTSSASTNGLLTVQCDTNQDGIVLRAENTGGQGSQPGIVFEGPTGTELVNLYVDNTASELRINTAGTERMRINQIGEFYLGAGIIGNSANGAGEFFTSGGFIGINNLTFSTSAICFRVRTGSPTMTDRMYIRNDGDLENSNGRYTSISDARLKENIVDANPQWDDIKSIRIRNFNFREDTGLSTHTQIGCIAQELETVCPGLVLDRAVCDQEGNPTDEIRKTVANSVLYMKAVKALQEAMERIETLEASNAALEARLTALEGGVS